MVKKVCITGGAGYVGTELAIALARKYEITVLDKFWYGDSAFDDVRPEINLIKGDIRNAKDLEKAFAGQDAVIHLACISNDPSFDLDPKLGKSINLDAFPGIIETAKKADVKRFIYASSSSVYGIKHESEVIETTTCTPLTDYSKFKLQCEEILRKEKQFPWTIVRPATVCGFSRRMRFDLVVNALTIGALVKNRIEVHGGDQLRPNLNIRDMVMAYELLLMTSLGHIGHQTFNVSDINLSIMSIAEQVREVVGDANTKIVRSQSDDPRSYHVSSAKMFLKLGFQPSFSVKDAIATIGLAMETGKLKSPLENSLYYNIRRMKEVHEGKV